MPAIQLISMKSILLVDDDKEEHYVFCKALSSIKYPIHCKAVLSARDALYHLHRIPYYHYIFLDVHMPDMNGVSCLREIKTSDTIKHIPVVIFTNRIGSQDVDECMKLGAMSILHKPNTISDLRVELEAILQTANSAQVL